MVRTRGSVGGAQAVLAAARELGAGWEALPPRLQHPRHPAQHWRQVIQRVAEHVGHRLLSDCTAAALTRDV
jgi:hypothetical protein